MHRHLSTGSATLAALMALQTGTHAGPARSQPPGQRIDIMQLLASMGEHGLHGRVLDEPATQAG